MKAILIIQVKCMFNVDRVVVSYALIKSSGIAQVFLSSFRKWCHAEIEQESATLTLMYYPLQVQKNSLS